MREVQGAIILAGVFEAIVGLSGIIGFFMRYIGPVTISPVICLIGLAVMDPAMNMAGKNWLVALICIAVIVLCSQYLNNIAVKIPFSTVKLPIFGLFPVLIGLVTSWLVCIVITFSMPNSSATSAFWKSARVDTRSDVIIQAPSFQFALPLQ